jgi:hypothetical protein
MPNRPIDSHRLAAARRKKFNLNFRAQGQIRDGKQAHPDLAEVDAKSTHAGRPGEDLHGGVQQLAMSATPVFDVGLEHHRGYRSGKGIALTLVGEGYGGSVEAIGTWIVVEIRFHRANLGRASLSDMAILQQKACCRDCGSSKRMEYDSCRDETPRPARYRSQAWESKLGKASSADSYHGY